MKPVAPKLFDATWYLAQNPDVAADGVDPWTHYLEWGAWELRNPHPLFDSQWYLEQNPEVGEAGVNPLSHYLEVGGAELRDPHPLMDSRTYCQTLGGVLPDKTPLEIFLEEGEPASAGAYVDPDALADIQYKFLDEVTIDLISDRRVSSANWAVFIQCGGGSRHADWLGSAPKPWHVIANFYDDTHDQPIEADLILSQNQGTKFSAINWLMNNRTEWLTAYEYVLFLDDDILIREESITCLFQLATLLGLHLAQPSVSLDSANTWPDLLQKPGSIGRYLNGVEIMMPLISRQALMCGSHLFGNSISGWGLDFALGQSVAYRFGEKKIAVIDAVSATHAKPIDPAHGAYYQMLKRNKISALVEERMMGLRYGAWAPISETI